MLPPNPYVAGNPVGDSPAFVGRADVLREVLRVLRRPQDNTIVLYGQRRIGKTSILQHLAAQLPSEGPYRPVYFDLQDKADWPLDRVLRELARTVAHALGQSDPARTAVEQAVLDRFADIGSDPETGFRDEWLPAVLGDLPEGSSLVLLFDEFDVLADPKGEQAGAAFFPYLRGLLARDPRRLQFVFVIGRNVDDLDNIARSLFKGTPAHRVSLLDREDTADLVRLSEANKTLRWPDEAMERVWQLTHGHPFLTQQLCSHVWERAYGEEDEEPEEPPTVTPEGVDTAVPGALEASRNTMEWLWDGLPPAERVVASALAEAGPDPISRGALERLLHESGVRVVIRELQNAPQLLQDWDLIEPADGGYRFRFELLRRWIADHKPLHRVQEKLDRIEPAAETLYRAALRLYQGGQLEQAAELLRQAIGLNPNHVKANQLLADILLAQGQVEDAQQLLERLSEYLPAAARPRLIQTLLAQVQVAGSDDEQLALYKRVLELDAARLEVVARVAEIEQKMRRHNLAARLQELEVLEQRKRYQDALDLAYRLAEEYPKMRAWAFDLERLERKTRLPDLYQRALGALQSGNRQTAQSLLAQVVALEPRYQEATRYLHLAVTGVDVAEIEQKMRHRVLATRLEELKALEQEEQYQDALDLMHKLAKEYPGVRDWTTDLERLEREAHLANLYQRALEVFQGDDLRTAQTLLTRVVALEPEYKEATRFLHLTVTGVDVAKLQAQLEAKEKAHVEAGTEVALDERKSLTRVHFGEAETHTFNPFFCSSYVSLNQFIDRRRELRRITARIINHGQSTAIVGGPYSGKTSLLRYLAAPEMRTALYGAGGEWLIFSYLGVHRLSGECTQAQFWEHVLRPLYKRVIALDPDSSLAQVYQICQENDFGAFVLERLLVQMKAEGRRLVLLLDEFDDLLHHPILNSAEFFGSLRSLASRSRGALALVIASRCSLASLNDATQQFIRTGSPYFDFLSEVTLGPWPDADVIQLLSFAKDRFNADDFRFVREVAGEHPYLLQVSAFELWEAYEAGEEEPSQRRREAGYRLYYEAARILDDAWRFWPLETRQVFTTIGLVHMNSLAQRGICGEAIVQPNGLAPKEKAVDRNQLAKLRQLLTQHFDEEELRTLCFDLGVDYDTLRGEGEGGKARELVAHFERHGRISELVTIGYKMRPHLSWRVEHSVFRGVPFTFQIVPPERLRRNFRLELWSLAKQGFVKEDNASDYPMC